MAQSNGLALLQRLIKVEPALVVDVMVEIDVHTCGGVVEQKPTCLRKRITVGIGRHQHSTYRERGFEQALGGIVTQMALTGNLLPRQALVVVTQQFENAIFQHETGSLEDGRSPRYELGQSLCLTRRQLVGSVAVLKRWRKMHE